MIHGASSLVSTVSGVLRHSPTGEKGGVFVVFPIDFFKGVGGSSACMNVVHGGSFVAAGRGTVTGVVRVGDSYTGRLFLAGFPRSTVGRTARAFLVQG